MGDAKPRRASDSTSGRSAGRARRLTRGIVASTSRRWARRGSLVDYYAASGYPPGTWRGRGLAGLDAGLGLEAGAQVSEQQMQRLYRDGLDPLSGQALGTPFRKFKPLAERIDARVAELPAGMDEALRAKAVARIGRGERAASRNAVAGFDLVFTPPKSVSALWAVADQDTQDAIYKAHRAAIDDALRVFEDEVAFTRVGHNGVAQVEVNGVIAAAFDHWDSRAGDPHLHTHVVVANRVQAADGRWRTLDSKAIHGATVALSEFHENVLADKLTQQLGAGWELRGRGVEKAGLLQLAGVPEALVQEFSSRAEQVEANLAEMVAEHREATGHDPSPRALFGMKQRAWRRERPQKGAPRSLADSSASWRERAQQVLGAPPRQLVDEALNACRGQVLTDRALPDEAARAFAAMALRTEETTRSTWTRANLWAETERLTRDLRFATAADRLAFSQRVTDFAINGSTALTPPELFDTPQVLQRSSGESVYRAHGSERYTSRAVLGAEQALLEAQACTAAAGVDPIDAQAVLASRERALSPDQQKAVLHLATSGRRVDVLVGPAGSGKTTTLSGLLDVWQHTYGPGSVVGLASSSKAAAGLRGELGISTENTHKWIAESDGPAGQRRRTKAQAWRRAAALAAGLGQPAKAASARARAEALEAQDRQWRFQPDQLVLVDEASMAGTLNMAALTQQATAAGARVVFVGDPAQLSAVEAGGAFRLLVNEQPGAQLTEVWRFNHEWERAASLQLRAGNVAVLETYFGRGRVHEGSDEGMLEAAYAAWRADELAGKTSLLIAGDNDTVRALNERARSDLVAAGILSPGGVSLHDGTTAGPGDIITTRKNDRRTTDQAGEYVRNADLWRVLAVTDTGGVRVQRLDSATTATLGADYAGRRVELAYALTAHRAQGATVDTSHAVITRGTTAKGLYVAMTRGREENHAYAVISGPDLEGHQAVELDGYQLLKEAIEHRADELSATETMREAFAGADSLPRLADIRDDMAAAASRPLPADADPAASLRARVNAITERDGTTPDPWRSPVLHTDDPGLQAAFGQVQQHIEAKVASSVDQVLRDQPAWLDQLPARQDTDAVQAYRWDGTLQRIVEARGRFRITDPQRPLGADTAAPNTTEGRQRAQVQRWIDQLNERRPHPAAVAQAAGQARAHEHARAEQQNRYRQGDGRER